MKTDRICELNRKPWKEKTKQRIF